MANEWSVVSANWESSTTIRVGPVQKGTGASRSTVGWIVRTVNVTPAVRWNELHDVRYTIANEGLESARVPSQPAKDYRTVGPRVDTLSWDVQGLHGVV